MNLPVWAKIIIGVAWSALAGVLASVGVPAIVISAIAAVLQQFHLLNVQKGVPLTCDEVQSRAEALHEHCQAVVAGK